MELQEQEGLLRQHPSFPCDLCKTLSRISSIFRLYSLCWHCISNVSSNASEEA